MPGLFCAEDIGMACSDQGMHCKAAVESEHVKIINFYTSDQINLQFRGMNFTRSITIKLRAKAHIYSVALLEYLTKSLKFMKNFPPPYS